MRKRDSFEQTRLETDLGEGERSMRNELNGSLVDLTSSSKVLGERKAKRS